MAKLHADMTVAEIEAERERARFKRRAADIKARHAAALLRAYGDPKEKSPNVGLSLGHCAPATEDVEIAPNDCVGQ